MTLLASSIHNFRRAALSYRRLTSDISIVQHSRFRREGDLFALRLSSTTATSTVKNVLTKQTLIDEIAKVHSLKKIDAKKIVDTLFDTITEAVGDGKQVKISNFGTIEQFTTKATTKRNPMTSEKLAVPSKKRIRFKAFKAFKDLVNP